MYEHLIAERFWKKVNKRGEDDCWEWTASTAGKGYGQFRLPKTRRNEYSHRVAYTLTHGAIPDGMFVCHKCDNVKCCNPRHLFLGTAKANQQDMAEKGRSMHGVKNAMTKMREIDIKLIFDLRSLGHSQEQIGKVVGLHQVQVGRILNGKRWSRLTKSSSEE